MDDINKHLQLAATLDKLEEVVKSVSQEELNFMILGIDKEIKDKLELALENCR